jgi:hypothetical protein
VVWSAIEEGGLQQRFLAENKARRLWPSQALATTVAYGADTIGQISIGHVRTFCGGVDEGANAIRFAHRRHLSDRYLTPVGGITE